VFFFLIAGYNETQEADAQRTPCVVSFSELVAVHTHTNLVTQQQFPVSTNGDINSLYRKNKQDTY
jgi:hypothetical protein